MQTETQTQTEAEAETEIIGMVVGLIKKATMMILDPISGAIKEFIVDTTTPFTTGFLDNIENFGTQSRKQGHETFEQMGDHTKRCYHGAATFPKRMVTKTGEGVAEAVSPITSKVSSAATSATDSVKDTAGGIMKGALSDIKGAGSAAMGAASWAGGKLSSALRKGSSGIGNVVSGVGGALSDIASGGMGMATRAAGRMFGMGDARGSSNKSSSRGGSGQKKLDGFDGAGSSFGRTNGGWKKEHARAPHEPAHFELKYGGGKSPSDKEPLQMYGQEGGHPHTHGAMRH